MFPCIHNSHSMFALGPCENCKRQRHKSRSAEILTRSAQQQFSGRSERSLPPERREFVSVPNRWNTNNPTDIFKRGDKRQHEGFSDNQNIQKTSFFKPSNTLINREIHHFYGGTYQIDRIDRRVEQRATLGSRSGKRVFPNDKPVEYPREIRQSLEQMRLDSAERQHRFDWDMKTNYRLGSSEISKRDNWSDNRVNSRSGNRPDLDHGYRPDFDHEYRPGFDNLNRPVLNSRSGDRQSLNSRSGDRQSLNSRSGPRLWLDNAADPRMSNSRGSDRKHNVWSRPQTREKLSTPSDKSVRITRRRVQLVDSPQFITETEKMRTTLPIIPNEEIKPILKRAKAKCVIVVHGKG